jgi:hypothetical protein
MSTSEARILANQANAQKSTDPKTSEGKERSRSNALKHGLTGAGIVIPEADAAEVERRAVEIAEETNASGAVGQTLARIAALNSVRLERGADQQAAALSAHVRRDEADFVPPEGVDEAQADRLRDEAVRIAMFDPSREATLARQYQASAERGFLRALKELRTLEKQARARVPMVDDETIEKAMASFFQIQKELDRMEAGRTQPAPVPPSKPRNRIEPGYLEKIDDIFDVPIAIGKRR